ncbi:siderophore-interacting protein [Salinibacterium soli]|uniref:Siderophore-interacting protein n=1 Tax=Antiquaquibacter soli TaxID=3064523 RepID=A0ABT9BNG1_9MICO|nr:siderophore-interacting protein [Protaetiibacter sp. WY-16]MDO7880827.1 siderophore-interacting protein [Protaetiibacter sp. WY-16]
MSRPESPFLLARAIVTRIEPLSSSFVRITFGGDELAEFGSAQPLFDQRIKLIFPGAAGTLPALSPDADWYQSWLALPDEERGAMRTYSVRSYSTGSVVVDFVLHLAPGLTGPASLWASGAQVGDAILLLGPRRGREWGGIEYAPGDARRILLAGDETAAPAIARILEDVDRDVSGAAFIEVPKEGDALAIDAPAGVQVHWMPRAGRAHGEALVPAVLDYLGASPAVEGISDADTPDPLWETPVWSTLGEELGAAENHADRYFWIAGESGVVTTLRRHLVKDLGIDRAQVAFMGYWRRGVAMRG